MLSLCRRRELAGETSPVSAVVTRRPAEIDGHRRTRSNAAATCTECPAWPAGAAGRASQNQPGRRLRRALTQTRSHVPCRRSLSSGGPFRAARSACGRSARTRLPMKQVWLRACRHDVSVWLWPVGHCSLSAAAAMQASPAASAPSRRTARLAPGSPPPAIRMLGPLSSSAGVPGRPFGGWLPARIPVPGRAGTPMPPGQGPDRGVTRRWH